VRFGERGESKEEEEEEAGGEEVVRGCPLNFISKNILIPTVPACPPFSFPFPPHLRCPSPDHGIHFPSSTKSQNYTPTLYRHPPHMPIHSFCASNKHFIGLKSMVQIAMK
jgi:hypothetical protein